jgi:hypothetical protein
MSDFERSYNSAKYSSEATIAASTISVLSPFCMAKLKTFRPPLSALWCRNSLYKP